MQGSAQTSPSQNRQIFLYRTGWDQGKPAAFDISVVSPLNSNVLSAREQEQVQHQRQLSLGSTLEMMQSVQSWGGCPSLLWWSLMGHGARRLSNRFPNLHLTLLSMAACVPKSMATFELYARLNISLVRANSRAMLSRS